MYFQSNARRSIGANDATTWINASYIVWYALAILTATCLCTEEIFCQYFAVLVIFAQISDPFTTKIRSLRFPGLGPRMLAMNLDREDVTDAAFSYDH